jgi:protein SCO1/2
VVEHLGQQLDLGLEFTDDRGRTVQIRSLLEGDRPVLLTLNYFRCRTLCDLQLRRLTQSLHALGDLRGREFRVVTVSIDPTDTAAGAAQRRSGYLRIAGRRDLDWQFLVGREPQIRALAGQLGFGYSYDARSKQYLHAPMAFLLAPDGRVVRYLYGLDYPAPELRRALIDAGEGKIGTTLDRVLLRCFEFDPAAGRYSVRVLALVRAGGAVTALAMLLAFLRLRRLEARR